MGKKFMGLGGTDHFWDRAKAWILNQITSAVTAKIAEVVANAPEDLDTLKEIADWISAHANDAAAMNTQITENKNNIATNTSDISALKTSVAGKADKVHTHSTDDITSGTLSIARGGTGVTTQAEINKAFIGNLDIGVSDVTDGTEFVSSLATDNGFADGEAVNTPYKRQFIKVWNYIKGKISSVLGLTASSYGGKASTAGTADRAEGISYTGESNSCISANQTFESYNNSSADWASYIICNHHNGTTYYHQMLRLPFFSDTIQLQRRVEGELKGWKNVAIMENENTWSGRQNFTTAKASSKMVIPIGAPSQLEDGCIWIER